MISRSLTTALLCGLLLSSANAADDYKLGPDSQRQPDVPRGTVTKGIWESKIFPGTVRDYWIYVRPSTMEKHLPASWCFKTAVPMSTKAVSFERPS